MTYADSSERETLISGLRALADFLQSNPEIPAPRYADVLVFPPHLTDAEKRREIDSIASRLGSGIEIYPSPHCHYTTSRNFGPVEYRAVAIPANTDEEQ